MARLSAMLIGNHEIVTEGSRWADEHIDPVTTLSFETKSSLIDLLQ